MSSPSSPAVTENLKPAWPGLGIWLFICFCAPALGFSAGPGPWFDQLHKPTWNPPGWLFGPVWTFLYLTMGVAAWLVWRRGGFGTQRGPLQLFLVQLALNALWTPLFFGLHQPGFAFVDIVFLWIALVATIFTFLRAHRPAGLLLLPYLVWVSFASFLNFTIWQLNR